MKIAESHKCCTIQMKPKIVLLHLILVLFFLTAGCTGVSVTIFPTATPSILQTTKKSTPIFQPSETLEPSPTFPPSPTPIPDSWLTFTDASFHLKFRFPENWQPESPTHYSGPDGYFELTQQTYPASEFDSISTFCILEANQNKAVALGVLPYVTTWQGVDPQMQISLGSGCTITPGGDTLPTPRDQAVLYARYPQPWSRDTLLVLRTDSKHFDSILRTLQFIGSVTPTPHPVNVYDSPACSLPLADPDVKITRTSALTITEYPLVNADCDPMAHFDGFQAHVRSMGLDTFARYSTDLVLRAEEADRLLEPFGYRLVVRQTELGGGNPVLASKQITVLDLYRDDEQLMANINRVGPVSVKASADDFIFWVEDTYNNIPPTEVRRTTLNTINWWETGFNTAWVGSDLIKYEYDMKTHLSPAGAPSQAIVNRNGQPVYSFAISPPGSAGYPIQWLYSWHGHWILEADNSLVEDGELQNSKLGYSEIFNWHPVKDKPFYFYREGNSYGISFDGQALPPHYDDVMHGLLCCDWAAYNINSLSNGAWFYARRAGIWYLVSVLANE